MRKLILLSWIFCSVFMSCNDDDDSGAAGYDSGASQRIKRITGEYSVWGKFQLDFSYESDGTLKEGWRINPDTGDTTGKVAVEYDLNVHTITFLDYYPGLDEEGIAKLKEMYPDTYLDTLKMLQKEETLCSVSKDEDGNQTKKLSRPRRDVGGGVDNDTYVTTYVKVSEQKQIPEMRDGKLTVVRCFDNKYGSGGNNNTVEERKTSKYEFVYNGNALTDGIRSVPDAYSETSWRKELDLKFDSYSDVLVGVDSDVYRMRRSADKVVVAEPGVNYTYYLNGEGLAVKLEMSTGDHFAFEYEAGSGNFYDLYAMPLDRVLGKVWVK